MVKHMVSGMARQLRTQVAAEVPANDLCLEHTMASLARLDVHIRREVLQLRHYLGPRSDEDFRGLYVSDADVEDLLNEARPPIQLLEPPPLPPDVAGPLDRAAAGLERRIRRLEARDPHGEQLRLLRLSRLFSLTRLEQEVVLLCLAPELDQKYERLYAYLQDDVTKKRPTVSLVLRLICPELEQRLAARRVFETGASLLVWDLVSLHEDPGTRRSVLLARYLKLDERIVAWLLGSDGIDGRLLPLLLPGDPSNARHPGLEGGNHDLKAGSLPRALGQRLEGWATAWKQQEGPAPVIHLHGRYGSGRREAARHLARHLGRPLLLLDATALTALEQKPAQVIKLAEREALLEGALLCWWQADGWLTSGGGEPESRDPLAALALGQVATVLITEKGWEPGRSLGGRPHVSLELPAPGYAERRALWTAELMQHALEPLPRDINALTARFQLTPGQMRDAITRARSLAWARDPAGAGFTLEDVEAACRAQAQHQLSTLARKLEPRYTWADIVLPRQPLAALRLICTMLRQRPVVYGDWGFDRKLARGKGVLALFAGPSGTGKTMAAEVIAHDLGLEVYKIDLSSVVSKFIGETEKNLERIFTEAEHSDAILFFDEADALFGRRSEVKDAHDRYANLEVAYLLQRTEEYSGLVILASNLKKNMDEAFVRRLHSVVEFPMPEEPERLEIWRRTLPAEAPLGDDLDLGFMARKFKLSGGSIRNIALTAAFLAADEERPIGMRQLVRATAHELQKMGKLLVAGDFEGHFEWVKG